MKRFLSLSFVSTAILVFIIQSISVCQEMNSDELAEKLVRQCGNIQENDIVWVDGGVRNLELLEDISTQVSKLGAFPLVTLSSDRITRRYYDEVPTKYDSQFPKLFLNLITMIDASISISSRENPALLADVPPERFVIRSKTFKDVSNLWFNKGVKSVFLGNNLYPTLNRAQMFKISEKELSKVFWSGVNVDYEQLQKTGKSLKNILQVGKELHITNTNGTDLKVKIEDRPIYVSDGVISDEDVKAGGAACQVWLPAGEVYLTPIPGTADGQVIVERLFYQGEEIENLKLMFKNGKLISMKAGANFEAFKARYDVGGEGKENFSFIDIGINPNVKLIEGSHMVAWMPAGMITIGIGGNTWAGGDNDSEYFSSFFLTGSTLKIDGKTVVKDGQLSLLKK